MKLILKAVCISFVLTVVYSMIPFHAECRCISDDTFRLHILANSDSEADQSLKLKVRDKVLEYTEELFESAPDKNAAESAQNSAKGYAQAAEASAQNASGKAQEAAQSASAAAVSADRAEQAATTAGYMWIGIDSSGHLIYERTDQVDADFSIDAYGHLIMEAI